MTTIAEKAKNAIAKNQTTNMLTKQQQKVRSIKEMMERLRPAMQASLQKQISIDYITSCTLSVFRQNPELMDCTQTSLMNAILQSTQLGLRLDGPLGHAYLVPYWNRKNNVKEAQFIPGYRGLIDMARRSGQIKGISAQCVRSADEFHFQYGKNEDLKFIPSRGDRGEITYVFACAHLKDGGFAFEVMSKEDIDKLKNKYSKSKSGPWSTDWEPMAKKTVIKRLLKYLPMSIEVANAVELDELAQRGMSQGIELHEGELIHLNYEEEEHDQMDS